MNFKQILLFLKAPAQRRWPWILGLFLLWAFLHKEFFLNIYRLSQGEAIVPYTYALYYFNNLLEGAYPLWDPFHNWGWVDNMDPVWIGLFNPVYVFVGIFRVLHVPPHIASTLFLGIYLFLALWGLFLLCRKFSNDEASLLCGFAAMLFSALSVTLFWQTWSILLVAPMVWFLYFLANFITKKDSDSIRMSAVGMTFLLMIIAVTYVPFFIVTVLLCVLAGFLLTQPGEVWAGAKKTLSFVKQNRLLFFLLLSAAILASTEVVRWYFFSKSGAMVIDFPRGPKTDALNVPLSMISISGLWSETSIPEMFSDLGSGMQRFSFLSFFIFYVLSLLAPLSAPKWWQGAFVSTVIVVLFFSTDAFPFHAWAYHHIPFISTFRNYFMIWPGVLIFLTFLAVTRLRELVAAGESRRGWFMAWLCVVTVLWLWYLHGLTSVQPSIYVTMALTAFSLILGVFQIIPWSSRLMRLLLLSAVIAQPLAVFCQAKPYFYSHGAFPAIDENRPVFSYERCLPENDPDTRPAHVMNKKRVDDSGFPADGKGYIGSVYANSLREKFPAPVLKEYVRYKFILFDGVMFEDPAAWDWAKTEKVIRGEERRALVYDALAVRTSESVSQPEKISGPRPDFFVKKFNVNEVALRTNFVSSKFVVYNDNFLKGWTVFIDGRKVPLYRSNVAFKGVWVPAGPHDVLFHFGSLGEIIYHLLIFFLFLAAGALSVYAVFRIEKKS
ncbi:MAG: hypothetical protein HQL16_05445 [Candidatus Omnitrophica bacterium]|nr:hypothetical protein [Candidatus Omnitrophota bacterium]